LKLAERPPPGFLDAPDIPGGLKVRWVKEGALREAIGLGGWFREEITAYERLRAYSYRVVRSIPPFDHEHAGGKLMEAVSRRLLRWSFLAVLAGCAKALDS
jgi:hypothetical protein